MYKRILVPLDGSAIAEQALPYAQLVARPLLAKIELLRVEPFEFGPMPSPSSHSPAAVRMAASAS